MTHMSTEDEATASEIAETEDRIAVEPSSSPDGVGYWDVHVEPFGHFWGCVAGEVLVELSENYDEYGVEVYHRDGSLWA